MGVTVNLTGQWSLTTWQESKNYALGSPAQVELSKVRGETDPKRTGPRRPGEKIREEVPVTLLGVFFCCYWQ